MFRFLLKPYPCNQRPSYVLGVGFSIGLFVFAFLYIFRPFEVLPQLGEHVLPLAIMYGAITTLVTITLGLLLPLLFPKYFQDEKWNIIKELFFISTIVFAISNANYFATPIYYEQSGLDLKLYFPESEWSSYWQAVSMTFIVGIIPCILLIMTNQIFLLRKAVRGSEEINESLSSSSASNTEFVISGEGKNELLNLGSDQFLFARSNANYTDVYYWLDNELKRQTIRSSLINIEQQVSKVEPITRVHRGYLANLAKVINVSGNAQGYRLHFANTDQFVPVSRNNSVDVKQRLTS